MKKILISLLAIPLAVSMFSGLAFGWGSTGGDGSRYTQLQETAVFFNNSGHTLYHGWACLLDLAGTDGTSTPTTGTTLGAMVDVESGADSVLVIGVTANASTSGYIDQGPVVVITKGPAVAVAMDSTDAVTSGSAVGTTVTPSATDGGASGLSIDGGQIGGGTNLGLALEAGDGTDFDEIVIWVDPTGAD